MSDVVQFPPRESAPDMRGADRMGNSVIIEGRCIPKFHMHDNGETISFILDERFLYEFPREWAYLAGAFAANAMAIGAGYSCLSAPNKDRPFAPECFQIDLGGDQ